MADKEPYIGVVTIDVYDGCVDRLRDVRRVVTRTAYITLSRIGELVVDDHMNAATKTEVWCLRHR